MSENILSTDPAPLPSGSDLEGSAQPADSMAGRSDPIGKKSPILLFISLALLSVVSVFAIYLFLQVRTLTLEATATPAPSPTPIASADPATGWQSYTYNKYFFSYPNDWTVKEEEYNTNDTDWKGTLLIVKNLEYTLKIDFPNTIFPTRCIFDDQNNVLRNEMDIDCSGDFIAIGTNMRRLLLPTKLASGVSWQVYTKSKDQYIGLPSISIEAPINYDQKQIELIDQILSTFKFTDPTPSPSFSPKLTQLKYLVPAGWTKIADPTDKFEAAYDPANTQVLEAGVEGLNLTRKSVNDNGIGFTSYLSILLKPYDGGSKHSFIYKYMNGGNPPQKQDLDPNYSEKEYSYNGKTCLFLNGIFLSQFPQIWGMCDAGSGNAYLISSYEPDPIIYLQTVQTIKLK